MKKLFLLCLLILPVLSFSQISNLKEIDELLNRQKNAWNKGNIEEYMIGYWQSDSLKFIGKNGITYGWNETLKRYQKSYPDKTIMGKLNFDILSKEPLGDLFYLVTGKWIITDATKDASGYFSLILKKINGQWQIIYDHSS